MHDIDIILKRINSLKELSNNWNTTSSSKILENVVFISSWGNNSNNLRMRILMLLFTLITLQYQYCKTLQWAVYATCLQTSNTVRSRDGINIPSDRFARLIDFSHNPYRSINVAEPFSKPLSTGTLTIPSTICARVSSLRRAAQLLRYRSLN